MGKTFVKDPNAKLDYHIDWSDWLGSDTISSSAWAVPDGVTQESDDYSPTTTTVWMSGGTAGESYDLVNQIETAAGAIDERTITILVREK